MRWIFFLVAALLLTGSVECIISEIQVSPGEKVTLPLTVKNEDNEEKTIRLSYYFSGGESIDGYFYYDNKRVSSIRLNSSESVDVYFSFVAPEKEGRYFLTLYGDGSTSVRLKVAYPAKPLEVTSDIRGLKMEAGDVAELDVSVENTLSAPYGVNLSCKAPKNWECSFYEGDSEVYKIVLDKNERRELKFRIDTDSSTDVGVYRVSMMFNNQVETLEVYITQSHAGEKGEVRLKVVDKDGTGVAAARVIVGNETFFTSGDGEAIFEISPGNYDIRIEKGGYYEKTLRDVKVKGGRTNDLGTVFLEKKAYYAELSVGSSKVSATIGDVTTISIRLENRGYAEDSYVLSVEGLPANYKFTFKEGNLAVSEVFVDPGESKDLTLELYVPPNAEPGEIQAEIVAKGRYEATQKITLTVVGEFRIYFSLEGGQYSLTASQGDEIEATGHVTNAGRGAKLTNVKVNLELPEGWEGKVEPELIPVLGPGDDGIVNLKIKVPANAKPSEYRVTVKVLSDQIDTTDRISVIVRERSYATYVGLGIIAVALISLILLIKKVGRR
ncbi:COG1470 family protein [Archaeoglobus neptunius]|uniref:COG1470 family protein n=1 Tax=Archaeoglobus neptunius TaxID=2798580 RepID=UPI001927DB7B|nr:NEW3 domain-containing protein [Archaeoglobus neptunius]